MRRQKKRVGGNKKTDARQGRAMRVMATMTKFKSGLSPSRRRFIKGAGVLATGIAAPALLDIRAAHAAYPDRPVKIVVANTPGGPSDLIGRVVAAALQESTGKTFVIENIGGGGSNIGMGYVAHAEPDGYTILLTTNAVSINATLYTSIPYDPLKDFVGVCELASSPGIFVVRSDLAATTLKEFVALARANPDRFNISTPPVGTSGNIQAELLKIRANLPRLETIVFNGGGDALQALLGGTVQLNAGSIPPTMPHIRAGTVRCLAIASEARWPDLPDVPTMEEAGYNDFVLAVDTAFLAPAKTPPENVKWLEAATLKVLDTPEMKARLFKAGFQVRAQGGEAAWARVTREIASFRDIINKAGVKKL
jgi:tripartite-type tricarboxylate transporter receptor subunit TctC